MGAVSFLSRMGFEKDLHLLAFLPRLPSIGHFPFKALDFPTMGFTVDSRKSHSVWSYSLALLILIGNTLLEACEL
jgi:hypothetical protein